MDLADLQFLATHAGVALAAAHDAYAAIPDVVTLAAVVAAADVQARCNYLMVQHAAGPTPATPASNAAVMRSVVHSAESEFNKALGRPCTLKGLTWQEVKGKPERVTQWFTNAKLKCAQQNMDVNDYRTALWLTATLPVDTPAADWWLGRCAEYPRQDYTPVVDYRAAIAADPLTGQQYVPEQPQYQELRFIPIGGCYTVQHLQDEYEAHFMTLSSEEEYRQEYARLRPSKDTKAMTITFNRLRPLVMLGHSQTELMASYSKLLHVSYRVRVFQVKQHTTVEELQVTTLAIHDAELRAQRIAKEASRMDALAISDSSSSGDDVDPKRKRAVAAETAARRALRAKRAEAKAATREAAKRGVKPNGTPIKRRRPCQWCGGDHLDSECKQSGGKRPKGTAAEEPASKPGDLSAHKSGKPEGKPSGKGKGTKAVPFTKRDREPLSDPDLEAAFQEGKCFVCGEKGHVSRHCPNK
jgi:hypothetical protein